MDIRKSIIDELKPHSRKIITEAEIIKDKINNGLFIDQAPKRELIEGITIDSKQAKDLDDGIWSEKTKFGYSVFISIADVSEYIDKDSLLDNQAKKKATTIYLNTHVYHMFPQILSTDIFSLNGNKKTLTQTLRVDLNEDYKILNTHSFESTFYNKKRFDYRKFNRQFKNPKSEFYEQLQLLNKITKGLKSHRIQKGSNRNFKECVTLNLDKTCGESLSKGIGQDIIAELALLKNIEEAKMGFKEKIAIIYRGYRPDLENKITGNLASNKGFFNFKPTYHAGLKQNFYTYNTSPIRRYSDLITQRQIKANIRKDEPTYKLNDTRKIAYELNTSIHNIINLSKKHNSLVNKKRAERLIKKLEDDNFQNIGSLSAGYFHGLIRYFLKYQPYMLNFGKIQEEIIYRIENNYLNKKTYTLLKSSPKSITEAEIFREIIKQKNIKEQKNLLY